MENLNETYQKSENSNDANANSHYILMAIGIVIGMAGIFLRFVIHWDIIDILCNIILIIGILLSLKAVFDILK